jgi:hypothetical protein
MKPCASFVTKLYSDETALWSVQIVHLQSVYFPTFFCLFKSPIDTLVACVLHY